MGLPPYLLSTRRTAIDIKYYIVNAKSKPVLLSGEASTKLQLVSRLYSIDEYPELKQLTGCLPGTYSIKIDPTVKPVVHAPRRQPKALAQKVLQKLDDIGKRRTYCQDHRTHRLGEFYGDGSQGRARSGSV